MRAFLRSSEGCFELSPRTTTIGRHPASDIVLRSPGVAHHHAALAFIAWDQSFVLQDLNSPHGTFVNGCQVQNAAVRVTAGDSLRFGTGQAASFQLVVEGDAQQEQPSRSWALNVTTTTTLLDSSSRSFTSSSDFRSSPDRNVRHLWGAPSLVPRDADCVSQKGEKLLQLDKEMDCLSGLGTEAKQEKEVVINLQDEITVMAKTLTEAAMRNEAELTQKLGAINRELGARTHEVKALDQQLRAKTEEIKALDQKLEVKTEEIKALREQIIDLQKGSSQIFSHSLYERDQEIGRLLNESEKLKKEQALATGLVSSLQREIAGKEQRIQQLEQEVGKMKKENREKDNQIAVISAKCSRIKEEMKHEVEKQEITTCRHRIWELERDMDRLQQDIQKHCAEQESIRSKLAEKIKAQEELEAACAKRALQLQEMGRREHLLRATMGQAKEQLESFKTQVMQACSPAAAGKDVSEQQVLEKVRQISNKSQQSHEREKYLQEELSSRLSEEKEVSANLELFQKSLQELQTCLKSSCSSHNLREELKRLEAMCLHPVISALRAMVVELARVPLTWLEGMEQLLASVEMDLHSSGKGLLATLEMLLENSQAAAQKNQMLQVQLEQQRESQATELQEQMKKLEAKYEQDLQLKIQQIILEKDKESKEMLESTVAKEKAQYEQAVEEGQKKIQDLETHLGSLIEEVARRSEELEVTNGKLRAAELKLEESTKREAALRQQVLTQDKQLRSVRKENELQQQKLREEAAEYKEQSKQHTLTIVALEDRLLETKQQQKVLEEEKAALVEKLEGFQSTAHESTLGAQLEACLTTEAHENLRKELAAAQDAVLARDAAISTLRRELAVAQARIVDIKGELSEELKVEQERSQAHLKHQEWELSLFQEKLYQMSRLMEKKDKDLQVAAEELRQAKAHCQALEASLEERVEKAEDASRRPAQAAKASKQGLQLELVKLGTKCRGLRHEEIIQRQQKGLSELRARVKMLEKMQSSAATQNSSLPVVVLEKDLPEEVFCKMGLKKKPAEAPGAKVSKVPGQLPNGGSQGPASLEAAEEMDFGEKMYLDAIRALGKLMEMKRLSGMQPLKNLPQEKREKAGMQRQQDLELLYHKVRNLKTCLQRKEERLKDYEAKIKQLRLNEASLQQCREEESKLKDEAYREAEEKVLLQETLERTQIQLTQAKKLLQESRWLKPAAKKPFSGKPKAKEFVAAAVQTGCA
ncbi:forkhead-associated domain-containing protein 1 [Falco cherrug]|uniref:forkhead-associated domain-containing protein 1 n=1 Tax=Falco cherrug TaxID=345164 RepID=UPI00247A65A3|nr:forkhead-associated domain-containing protein 1 [Falco cherrug]